MEAVGHVHQSGLAGAVLSQESVQLAALESEVHTPQCPDAAEALLDLAELEDGGICHGAAESVW
jgi:hypothetical protein